MDDKILKGVDKYYTDKINQYGANASGVDWNSKESQYLRFEQLCKVISGDNTFSVIDYGCGYAELINYLSDEFKERSYDYFGYDVSTRMIDQAKTLFGKYKNVKFYETEPSLGADYVIASGIFNVKVNGTRNEQWLEYIIQTIHSMNQLSVKGFSFNALTKYSDKEYMKDYLFYADPLEMFDYCKNNFSQNVALLHDYNLYEFTIIVRK